MLEGKKKKTAYLAGNEQAKKNSPHLNGPWHCTWYQGWAPSHRYIESFASPHQQLDLQHEASGHQISPVTKTPTCLLLEITNPICLGKLDNAVQYPQALP